MIYRIMTEDGNLPKRAYGFYTVLFDDHEYAKRCLQAIKQFNKNVKLIIEKSETNWQTITES